MRKILFIISGCAILALAGCGKPEAEGPLCVASELAGGVVSLHTPSNYQYSCGSKGSAVTMADYISQHPELDVTVVAFNRYGAITTLRTTPKAKAPAAK